LEEQEAAKSESENNMWKLEEELEGLREEVDKEKKLRSSTEKAKKLLEGQVEGLNEQ